MNKEVELLHKSPMNNKFVILAVGLVLILGIVGFLMFNKKTPSTPYPMDEISKHTTREDCWTTINGGVYNVTKFISNHEGGDRILSACGKDATDLFTGKSPMGRVHSAMAVKLLSKMKIGELQK